MTFEELLMEQQQKNINYTMEHIDDKEYEYKLNELSKIVHMSIDDIKESAKHNRVVAYCLSKQAKKQNLVETFVLNELQRTYPDAIKMSTNTSKSIRFDIDGNLIYGPKSKLKGDVTKSVDYRVTIDGMVYYLTQKYTNGEGGAQDNQYADIIHYIDLANRNKNRNYGIGVIVDGSYFTSKRINHLKELFKDVKDFLILQLDK